MSDENSPFEGGAQAVLFDLDGTLVDTAPDMVFVLTELLAERGRDNVPYELARNNVSNGALGLLRLGFPNADEQLMKALHTDYLDRYLNRVCERSTLFPGLSGLLDRLEAARRPWGVVTNKPQRMTDPLLDQLGLLQRTACAISGDTLAQRKPHPAPLLHASKLIGVAPQHCIYVGDAARDIEAGRAAGMATIAVGYGYITDDDSADAWGADRIATDTRELTTLLAKAVNLDT